MTRRGAQWIAWAFAAYAAVVVACFAVANAYGYAVFGDDAERDDATASSNRFSARHYHK